MGETTMTPASSSDTDSPMTTDPMPTDPMPTDAVLPLETPGGGEPCAVCPHPWSEHDTRDVRFCTATAASSSARGCICH